MHTMVKEKDRYMGTHVEEGKILFSAVTDCHIVLSHGVATTKMLE